MKKAVFLDKDGTLINNISYSVDTEKVALTPFAAQALFFLKKLGFNFYVISNQSGIGRKLFTFADLLLVEKKIQSLLLPWQVQIDKFYYCGHLETDRCSCRKPRVGLLEKAKKEGNLSFKNSFLIGDILNDTEAGNKVGCKTILIDNGNETEWKKGLFRKPDFIAKNLFEAAIFIAEESYQKIYEN